jgi:hypothetical protein
MKSTQHTDLWPVLPASVRTAARQVAADGWQQATAGVPGFAVPWRPTRPFFLARDHLERLGQLSARLARLVLAACQRRAGTAGELAAELGVLTDELPLLDRGAPLSEELLISMRPDIVHHGGTPKFVELNIDGGVGGSLQVDVIGPRFLDAYRRVLRGDDVSLQAPPSSAEARLAAIREQCGQARRVVIPVFGPGTLPGLTDPGRFISWLSPMCEAARRHGLDALAVPLDELTTGRGGLLHAGGLPADLVIRLFLFSAQPPGPGTRALARAVLDGTVTMHTPEATMLLSDKRTLAWLWADVGSLDAGSRELVRRHVPWTAYLPPGTGMDDPLMARALAGRPGLVLKPAGGHGGIGVVIGPRASAGQWRTALAEAGRLGGYVLQEYCEPDRTEIEFAHAGSGERRTALVPFTIAPFLFGLRPSGVYIRHGAPGGSEVLNLHYGAVPNTALLVDGPC